MKHKIKFIYFDVGGVMLRWHHVLDLIAKKHNKPIQEVKEVFYKYDRLACFGEIDSNEAGKNILKELKVPPPHDFDFFSFSMEHFTPIVETHTFAKKLSNRFSIGLLTNIYHGVVGASIQKGHIPDLQYTTIVESCRIGIIKPQKEIYEHAREKAGVAHEEILFIDDYEENIKMARTLGWQGFIFDTKNPVKSIKEIEKLLVL